MVFRRSFLILALALASCVSTGPSTKPNEKEWKALTAEHQVIREIRTSSPRAADKPTRREQIEVQLETHKKIEPLLVPFLQKLKEYYERTGDPRAATLYADERVTMGDEYYGILARYDRAVSMYQGALAIDPSHAVAKERLAAAEARRFVSMDLFASVKTSMTEDQVRKILGQPREDWIKQVIQKNRVYSVWIYPKNDGGASAVYFDGGLVYHTNWNAAPAKPEAR
jgi:hypothetical protein